MKKKSQLIIPTSMRLPRQLLAQLRTQAEREGHGQVTRLVIELLVDGLRLRKLEQKARPHKLYALSQQLELDVITPQPEREVPRGGLFD